MYYSSSSSYSYEYSYEYEYNYSYTYDSGEVCNRSVSIPIDCFDRFNTYKPQQAITQQKFMKVVRVIMNGPNSCDAEIREAFNILDADGSGKLSVCELSKVIPAIIPGTTLNTLNTIIRRYDKNGDNQLNLCEFTNLIKRGIGRDVVYRDIMIKCD